MSNVFSNYAPFPPEWTPLHKAARMQRLDEVLKILKSGVDPTYPGELRDARAETPLHIAAEWATPAVVLALRQYGADANALDRSEHTPLMKCVISDVQYARQNVDALLRPLKLVTGEMSQPADPNIPNLMRYYPLHIAASANDIYVINLLLLYGARRNVFLDEVGVRDPELSPYSLARVQEALNKLRY